MDVYGLRNLIKSPTCYKTANNPSLIDMFLKNKTSGFQNTTTKEVGLSDFHLMILTVLKSGFVKKGPRIVTYCCKMHFGYLCPTVVSNWTFSMESSILIRRWRLRPKHS